MATRTRTIIAGTSICALVLAIGAGSFAVFPKRPNPSPPLEYLDVLDVGMTEPGVALALQVPIRNKSNQAITVSRFSPSCGCLSLLAAGPEGPRPLSEKEVLLPGDTLVLLVNLNTPNTADPRIRENVSFDSDIGQGLRHSLTIKGMAIIRLFAHPSALVSSATYGEPHHEMSVFLIDARAPSRRTAFGVSCENISLQCVEVRRCDSVPPEVYVPRGCHLYRAVVRASQIPQSGLRSTLVVRADSGEVLCVVPVELSSGFPISVRPSTVVVPRSKFGQPMEVRLEGAAGCPIEVKRAPPWVSCKVSDSTLSLTVDDRTSPRKTAHDTILLSVDMKTGPVEVELPLWILFE